MKTITKILLDAEEQERHSMLNMDQEWFENLRDAVNEANILFDEAAIIAYRKQLQPGSKWWKEVCLFFSPFNQLDFAFTMSGEVRKLVKTLNEIASDRRDFASPSQGSLGNKITMPKGREDSHSILLETKVIGRDKDKKAVSDFLLVSSVDEDFYFVSIVGIGGLGKTTLAQYIYNDTEFSSKFSLTLWVCVSDYFDFEMILRKLLQSVKPENYDHVKMQKLCCLVQEHILVKKFLLVLDDVWNENRKELLELKNLLMKGEKGSRIIVTTRSMIVARNIGDVTFELESLLFDKWAFTTEDRKNRQLVEIGREILTKCAKAPLVITTIGSLLYGEGEEKWKSFRDTDLEKITQGDNKESILKVLK